MTPSVFSSARIHLEWALLDAKEQLANRQEEFYRVEVHKNLAALLIFVRSFWFGICSEGKDHWLYRVCFCGSFTSLHCM